MNYYEHHIGDYDAATAHLSWAEDMAYTRLLRLYYRKEQPIPADVTQACRLIRATSKEQREAVESVLQEFFELGADGWHQGRCDSDIDRYQKKVDHNRAVGKLGGRPKKSETQAEPNNNPGGFLEEPKRNPRQSPDTKHQIPPTPKGAEYEPEGFALFWSTWPRSHRKGGKEKCFEVWKRARLEADAVTILKHVEAMAATKDWIKDDGQFVPAPVVYLRSKAWSGADLQPNESTYAGAL